MSFQINPPPKDKRCECCRTHVTSAPEEKLMKDFRENSGCVGAYWVCILCMGLGDKVYWKLYSSSYSEKGAPSFWEWLDENDEIDPKEDNIDKAIDTYVEQFDLAK